jgi:hypothetical protein
LAVPEAVDDATSVILMSPKFEPAAIPFALNPAVVIVPAVFALVVRLSPDVISAMLE